jgi:hypothetical protein
LILVQGGKHGFCFGFLQADINFPSNVYWRDCLFSIILTYLF